MGGVHYTRVPGGGERPSPQERVPKGGPRGVEGRLQEQVRRMRLVRTPPQRQRHDQGPFGTIPKIQTGVH